jgi:hypothetical protein
VSRAGSDNRIDVRSGTPVKVFHARYAERFPARYYDVSPDGQRFLMVKDSPADDQPATRASIVLVEHWFEELKQRVNGKYEILAASQTCERRPARLDEF